MKLLLLVLVLVALSQTKLSHNIHAQSAAQAYPDQTQYWFEEQILDHFVEVPVTHWKQRYFVYEKSFEPLQGPLFIYIGGEGNTEGVSTSSALPIYLANQYKGMVVTLEHRFYGESQPFGQNNESYSIENLKYLNHEQALADLANFIGYLKKNNLYNLHEHTPVITIGGSYPGALSAWFRQKYRHLTIGALASSAVVHAIENYEQFDAQIRLSTKTCGDFCPDSIANYTQYIQDEILLGKNGQQLKESFGCGQLGDVDFLYYVADLAALQVQYGKNTHLCNTMLKGKTLEQQIEALKAYSLNNSQQKPSDYDPATYKNTTYSKYANVRQWTYQTCTYVGWFYDAAFYKPMRSRLVDVNYFRHLCRESYGQDYVPDVNYTNLSMGGTEMRVDNIIFTNGVEDPWKWASILEDKGPMKSLIVRCQDCGHCVDLHTPSENNDPEITRNQKIVSETMGQWIAQYWDNLGEQKLEELQSFVRSI